MLLITGHHRPGEPPVQRGRIRAAVHDWLAASRHAARHRRGARRAPPPRRRRQPLHHPSRNRRAADAFLTSIRLTRARRRSIAAARGAHGSMKAGTAQKISNAILSCAAGFASFLFSLAALLYLTEFDAEDPRRARRRRLLPAGQLHRLGAAQQRKRPRAGRARRAPARGRGRRPRLARAARSSAQTMPKLAAAVDSLFAEVRASIENAHALGMYDPVTSLPNRLHFRSEADKLLERSRSTARSSAMLFVDLDRFKMVNDSLGHARGDQLLIMVANRLRVVVNAEFTGSARSPAAARAPRRRRVHDVLPRDRVGRRDRAGRAPHRRSPSPSRSSCARTASTSAPRSASPSRPTTAPASNR